MPDSTEFGVFVPGEQPDNFDEATVELQVSAYRPCAGLLVAA